MPANMTIRLFAILPAFFLGTGFSFAQSGNDSKSAATTKTDSVQQSLSHKTDSLQQAFEAKFDKADSLQDRLLHDNAVSRSSQRIDSIQASFYQRSDSVKHAYKKKLVRIDSSQLLLRKKLDSLTTLDLPTNKVSHRLDSLNKLREETVGDFGKKLQSIKDSASAKLKKLDLPPEASDKLNAVTQNIENFKIPGPDLNTPSVDIPGNPLGNVAEVGKLDLPGVNNPLPGGISDQVKVPDGIGEVKDLTNGTEKISEVSGVTGQVTEYSKEAQEIAKGNLDTKKLSTAAEEKAVQASGVRELEGQTKTLDEYKAMTTKAQDPEALKKEALAKAKEVAVNHFAGKEQQLKAAMEKISKYKQKYSSLNGLKELSQKPPNEMRNKSLRERIVPGVAFQIQKKGEDFLLDVNGYAGYRFTGRLRAGLGWNQRIGYNLKAYHFSPDTRVFGPRAFGEYKLGKGFSPRLEVEAMNTTIPPLQSVTYDPNHREWVCGVFVGIKKEYKVYKNVKGTAMIMARLFNPDHKSPYADLLSARFGFEFPMKKKVKKG